MLKRFSIKKIRFVEAGSRVSCNSLRLRVSPKAQCCNGIKQLPFVDSQKGNCSEWVLHVFIRSFELEPIRGRSEATWL